MYIQRGVNEKDRQQTQKAKSVPEITKQGAIELHGTCW